MELIKAAVSHRGFSLLNILQPCVSWDKVHTYRYYDQHCFEPPAGFDPGDQLAALELVLSQPDRYPLGVIYRSPRPTYEEQVLAGQEETLRERAVEPKRVRPLLERFR